MSYHPFATFFATLFIAFSSSAITIQDALQQKLITINVRSYTRPDDSVYRPSFYNECILIEVKNLKGTTLQLNEDAGRFLMPDDSSLQRMVMTAPVSFALGAYQKKDVPVYAMCSEANDGAPSANARFTYGSFAEDKLLAIVQMIALYKYQNNAGQNAIWCVTDNHSPYSIYSQDTAVTNKLRQFVCNLKGIKYIPNAEREEVSIPLFRHITGDFHYTIQRTHVVDVKIFTGDGKLVEALVDSMKQTPGSYTYGYEADIPVNDPSNLPSIIIKFYLDGKLLAQKEHVLGSR